MTKQYMKEKSGKDSNVEFQSGTTKEVAKPKPRPKSIGKQYSNPPRKPVFFDPGRDQQGKNLPLSSYTGIVYNPEPKEIKKTKKNLPLSGKQKRMDKGKSRLNPFVTYGETKKKKEPLKFKSPSGKEGGSDALYRVPELSRNKKKKLKT